MPKIPRLPESIHPARVSSLTRVVWLGPVLLAVALLPLDIASAHARTLSLEQRVTAQRAIEQVYWNHRIWPEGNPGAKPPLSAVISDAQIRAKVEAYLQKSSVLETEWQKPITPGQLQAEMDRMAANTHDPEMLQELFEGLGNDPYLIAETLARQTLVEGLIRDAYTSDPRHRDEAAREGGTGFDAWWAERRAVATADLLPPDGAYSLPSIATAVCSYDTWGSSLVSSGSVPTARRDHSAVWTGTEMIVWGGIEGGATTTNTGGRYTPATDSWGAATSMSGNVPLARQGHTAVWTGTEMIIWGGGQDPTFSFPLNDGGRYNPATDAWGSATLTSGNVPSPRAYHSAVWTGTQMIGR